MSRCQIQGVNELFFRARFEEGVLKEGFAVL
jgi:hypothetical protein